MMKIGYTFSNISLLREAVNHPSVSYIKKYNNSYERLEFLGDTILSMVSAEMLFLTFLDENEGDLSKRHIELVKGETLAEVAIKINLGKYIIMSGGEKNNGGLENIKNLENAMEALIGAIYIDGGFDIVKDFISKHWMPILKRIDSPPENVKSILQEWAQKRGLPPPTYKIIKSTGPPHSPIFSIEVSLVGFPSLVVNAKNKRRGEQMSAELMLKKYILNNA